jgi:predicted amidohydrolase YtcJ
MKPLRILVLTSVLSITASHALTGAEIPDLIIRNALVVTMDNNFQIFQAVSVKDSRILDVGSDGAMLKDRGPKTRVVDAKGKMLLPGLIDSHVHPAAAMTEFDHSIPEIESVHQVLKYIRSRADAVKPGEWIVVRQIFITRLREQRYPTRAELDAAAPKNPVNFSTGPDSMLNSMALKLSGIDKSFKIADKGPGKVELDPATGEPTGLLRGLGRYIKMTPPADRATERDRYERTLDLFHDYNSVGITTVCDRNASQDSLARYATMRSNGVLTVRMMISHSLATLGPMEDIAKQIKSISEHPLRKADPMLHIIGVKAFLDGGMLTGSAYMIEPWGVSTIYGISDPNYRGVLNIPKDRLAAIVKATADAGLQFTAHSVGDGAVQTLIDTYEELSKSQSIKQLRPCVTHCNFMTAESIAKAARLGVVMDIQPIWLYMDARTLVKQFGYDRLRYFQPLRSLFEAGAVVGGGSDHMQKMGSIRSINPFNPFLGMYAAVTRQARWYDGQLHDEEALSRQQALRMYTRNNAQLLFLENQVGTIEPGKLADFTLVDRNLLTCPDEDLPTTQVLQTYTDGKLVYDRL